MARGNAAYLAFNRGLIDKISLGRVDLDRTKLSAEVYDNWLPKTQGAMIIRPGSKWLGGSYNDTGASWIEFIASTTDVALLELTANKMRVWDDDALLARVPVATTIALTDTGWAEDNLGGGTRNSNTDLIPRMTGDTTGSVHIYANNSDDEFQLDWFVGDNDPATWWDSDTGSDGTPTAYLNVDFGSGNATMVGRLAIRAGPNAGDADNTPTHFRLLGNNHDTGINATDTGQWTLEVEVSGELPWAIGERRIFTDTGYSDTGANAWRHWRLLCVDSDDVDGRAGMSELELYETDGGDTGQTLFSPHSGLTLNAGSTGGLARVRKRVAVDTGDQGVEHALAIDIERGPVRLRVGSSDGDDDYINEFSAWTGHHNLAFTPDGSYFYVTIQTEEGVDRKISSVAISDTGTVEIETPWDANTHGSVRYDQSADFVFTASGTAPYAIQRRDVNGRSWSVVDSPPRNGPFINGRTSSAKLSNTGKRGNIELRSDIPYFRPGHIGALFRIQHDGQSGKWQLSTAGAHTDNIQVTGIGDTGTTPSTENERQITFAVSGTWAGTIEIQRSFDDPEYGYKKVTDGFVSSGASSDTGTFTTVIDDEDDNLTVWYRAKITEYTSGTPVVDVTYKGGFVTGVAKVTGYITNKQVEAEVQRQFSDTGGSDVWEEGAWSGVKGYPTAVAFHEGRLTYAGKSTFWASVSDDFTNHDDTVEGESAPIARSLGAGPVDSIHFLISLQSLIAGTSGAEVAIRSSNLDEPITADNSSARAFSTVGSADIRAAKHDVEAFIVQRSERKAYLIKIGFDTADYEPTEMSVLVPSLLKAGVVDMAIQRQPDSRVHFVLSDGTVAILTYESREEVLAWSTYTTNGSVESAMVLPGIGEDQVYYHINRTVNGVTKRFLEKWAMEDETAGDTGLNWLSDCAVSFTTDTGRQTDIPGGSPLVGESVVAWANDTGQDNKWGRDLSFDTGTPLAQTTYAVDTGGGITAPLPVKHVVYGLGYNADWKSTKLAFAAEAGTALAQMKRTDKIAFVAQNMHNNALFFGSDTGNLDPLSRYTDEGGYVDRDKVFAEFDQVSMPFPGLWAEDSRIYIRAKAPRPVTMIAVVPTIQTNERV